MDKTQLLKTLFELMEKSSSFSIFPEDRKLQLKSKFENADEKQIEKAIEHFSAEQNNSQELENNEKKMAQDILLTMKDLKHEEVKENQLKETNDKQQSLEEISKKLDQVDTQTQSQPKPKKFLGLF